MESCQNLQANSKFDNPCDQTLSWKPILSLNCSRLYRNVAAFDGWHVWALDVTMVKPTQRHSVNQPINCWLSHSPLIGLETNLIRVLLYIYIYRYMSYNYIICKIFGMHMRLESQVLRDSSALCWGPAITRLAWLNLCVEKRWDAPRETWIMDGTFAKWARKRREQYLQRWGSSMEVQKKYVKEKGKGDEREPRLPLDPQKFRKSSGSNCELFFLLWGI